MVHRGQAVAGVVGPGAVLVDWRSACAAAWEKPRFVIVRAWLLCAQPGLVDAGGLGPFCVRWSLEVGRGGRVPVPVGLGGCWSWRCEAGVERWLKNM